MFLRFSQTASPTLSTCAWSLFLLELSSILCWVDAIQGCPSTHLVATVAHLAHVHPPSTHVHQVQKGGSTVATFHVIS